MLHMLKTITNYLVPTRPSQSERLRPFDAPHAKDFGSTWRSIRPESGERISAFFAAHEPFLASTANFGNSGSENGKSKIEREEFWNEWKVILAPFSRASLFACGGVCLSVCFCVVCVLGRMRETWCFGLFCVWLCAVVVYVRCLLTGVSATAPMCQCSDHCSYCNCYSSELSKTAPMSFPLKTRVTTFTLRRSMMSPQTRYKASLLSLPAYACIKCLILLNKDV